MSGFVGPLIAFAGIGIAILIHRDWWSITDNAISDLGRIGLEYNFVLNISLMASSMITLPSALWITKERRNIVEGVGVSLFILALIGLFLIGTFPEGTSLHGPVSYLFFYGGTFAMLIAGAGLAISRAWQGYAMVIIVVTEIILAEAALMVFRGVAIPEFIAAVGIVASYYLLIITHGIGSENLIYHRIIRHSGQA